LQIKVGNATDHSVSNVWVSAGTERIYGTPAIAPHTAGPTYVGPAVAPTNVQVTWQSPAGEHQSRQVDNRAAGPDFHGCLFYQINRDGNVQLYPMPAEAAKKSDLPWGMPQRWEGAPGIPGFNQP
jgi:hypothetical protein